MQQVGNAFPRKVSLSRDSVGGGERLSLLPSQQGRQLSWCEQVVFALLAVAVGILRAVKCAVGRLQLTPEIIRDPLCNAAVKGISRHVIGTTISGLQQCVVVQHFFKVRDKEKAVG